MLAQPRKWWDYWTAEDLSEDTMNKIIDYVPVDLWGGPWDGLRVFLPQVANEHRIEDRMYVKIAERIDGSHIYTYQGKVIH